MEIRGNEGRIPMAGRLFFASDIDKALLLPKKVVLLEYHANDARVNRNARVRAARYGCGDPNIGVGGGA
jgi:hypothetical protein